MEEKKMSSKYFVHPAAIVESDGIGAGTRIWAHVHVMKDVLIGSECNICDGCFIESGAKIGRGVTIKTGVSVGEGVTIEDGVFIGPHVAFTNDLRPRSPRLPLTRHRYATKGWLSPTLVKVGATIGAGATIGCGITIGEWSFIAAGAVILNDVAPFTFMVGNPARPIGHVCMCAEILNFENAEAKCLSCERSYRIKHRRVELVNSIESSAPFQEAN